MLRFFMLLSVLFLLLFSWPLIEKQMEGTDLQKTIDHLLSEVTDLKENPETIAAFDSIKESFQELLKQFNLQAEELSDSKQEIEPNQKEIELNTPTEQMFSVYNIELGKPKSEIDHSFGAPKRSSINEYGTYWYTYHENYQDFFMVMYDEEDNVAGLYTNQGLIASTIGIKLDSSKESVRTKLGEPLTKIQKGMVIYQLQENSDNDIFQAGGAYVTIFYDKHEGDTVTAIQLISEDLEQKKTDFYTKASPSLKEGFELQMFDLTNATRVNHQLPILLWDDHVRETARSHSEDMAKNQYFDHTNLEGQSPFDRMEEDNVTFMLAGENLATGQLSSIFAHEGLMNSLGHRENILKEDYEFLGVGVAFNQKSQPYYTQNYFAK
ncbi:CAP domain-containing protein [Neobacillus sp. FSL H8-0543]|uniref:CAP domain-containing protein n=1 Tax=Neobacillus sp. FSL H8-0543 TaxID=2954672 RepID=UPI0031586824